MRKALKSEVMRIISGLVVNQKRFDYKYYISKNCPLPENWRERKL